MGQAADEPKPEDLEAGSCPHAANGAAPSMHRTKSTLHFWEEDVFPELHVAPDECK